MFLGHYGVAFALKRAEPKLSLGTLFLAVQLADLLWGIFLLLGWERVRIDPGYTAVTPLQFLEYPISHSLVGMTIWALIGAAVYYSWPTRDTSRHWQAAALVGFAILSHFPLDAHGARARPAALGPGLRQARLRPLEQSRRRRSLLELATLAAGVAVYVGFRSRRHPVRPGTAGRRGAGPDRDLSRQRLRTSSAERHGDRRGGHHRAAAARRLAAWADRRATPAELAAAGLPAR